MFFGEKHRHLRHIKIKINYRKYFKLFNQKYLINFKNIILEVRERETWLLVRIEKVLSSR